MTAPTLDNLTLNLTNEIQVRAPIAVAFDALLAEMGPSNQGPEGTPLPMTLEAWPGGRWFRDLGAGNGHFWGHVQAIKKPTLLEISGPLFVSGAVISNVQYRLKEVDGGTLISFRHSMLGFMPAEHSQGVNRGWTALLARVQARVESRSKTH